MSAVYIAWTDPESGRRELRVFGSDTRGLARLRRYLKNRDIPHAFGAVAEAGHATRPSAGRSWSPDPRVWTALDKREGAAT